MKTKLLLVSETFCWQGEVADLNKRLIEFCELVRFITSPGYIEENSLTFESKEFLNTEILPDCKVSDVISNASDAKKKLTPDVCRLVLEVFQKVKANKTNNKSAGSQTDKEEDESKEVDCILVLQHNDKYPAQECVKNRILSTIFDLTEFRMNYAVKHKDSAKYFDQADKYCLNLRLHKDIRESREYKAVYKSHCKQINTCLLTLNRDYILYYNNFKGSKIKCVECFASEKKFCDGGSYEGSDILKQQKLIFEDRDNPVYVEPHLKMNSDDKSNEKKYCRIYFEDPRHGLNKLYIGFICKHK